MKSLSRIVSVVALFAGSALCAFDAATAEIVAQPACGAGNTACVTFDSGDPVPRSVRNFTFVAPRAGTALVEFHGSMRCTNGSIKTGGALRSGISQSATATPTANSPGGLRHDFVFPPDGEITFNLASSRLVSYAAAGSKTFHFNLTGTLGNGIACSTYNAAFRVVFD